MACNLDEDIKYFLKQQKLKIKENIESTRLKNYFTSNSHDDMSVSSEHKNGLNLRTDLFSQS